MVNILQLWNVLCCVIGAIAVADPDPKKYKLEALKTDKKADNLTTEERNFLREVEEKFGVKSQIPSNSKETENKVENKNVTHTSEKKLTLPAVIAIEIVNDTDAKGKGKRTIDANLGYGYRTNNGYTYNYFGKSAQDKGKFMIYPYSQEDIPAHQSTFNSHYVETGENYQKTSTNVEIQPSQAFELVPVKEQQTTYDYKKPEVEFKTPSPPTYGSEPSSTLYTTYNGQEFSGLSAQFPTVMPNYFVDPSQLLTNPQYQSAGLTQDHLRSHESQLGQRIVPVLVLRIPSSSIKNPSAELYANLPNNYPLSSYLNNVNLQQLVNQYFKKQGYSFAPQIMAYQNSNLSPQESEPHYAHPYVKPSYTQSDYSGVQYSAVKPVMARYPSSYSPQKYVSQSQSLYRQPSQQQYEYQYQYMPQTAQPTSYYVQSQYEQPSSSPEYQHVQTSVDQRANVHETHSVVEHKVPEQTSQEYPAQSYDPHHTIQQSVVHPTSSYYTTSDTSSAYEVEKENAKEHAAFDPNSYTSSLIDQKAQVSVYPSRLIHSEQYEESSVNSGQEYTYQSQQSERPKALVLSENYPSKDHTIAAVFPNSYSAAQNSKPSVQTVSYVTPMPSAKYQSQFRIMVPQTVFKPTSDKVAYVNSKSMHYNHAGRYTHDVEPEEEYTRTQYVPSVPTRPSYPRNYHSHPKRMAKPDNKAAASSKVAKKNETTDKKST
ncbi:uncharacterized protein LOC123706698 [Pieris brassicae]|uniref:uncharacterized protein LOC123706698 n=1 Tax=Pieris brassicae TaxID=7116 RepID=UPI001E65F414|nr:uncharacterized protein LOC123706698 [Pieris brassicae]